MEKIRTGKFCAYLGEYIGSAEALLPVPLYECKLAKAYWRGKAQNKGEEPKFYCRVNNNVKEQEKCVLKSIRNHAKKRS